MPGSEIALAVDHTPDLPTPSARLRAQDHSGALSSAALAPASSHPCLLIVPAAATCLLKAPHARLLCRIVNLASCGRPARPRQRLSWPHNTYVSTTSRFAELAVDPDATLDVLALCLAAEFRDVNAAGAMARLDSLGAELLRAAEQMNATPEAHALACGLTIGAAHGFVEIEKHDDDPANSMLDLVLTRRRGLPILLSVVYVEVARRAGDPARRRRLAGPLRGRSLWHRSASAVGSVRRGGRVETGGAQDLVRPWRAHEVGDADAQQPRDGLPAAGRDRRRDPHAAGLRLALPDEASNRDILDAELQAMQARLELTRTLPQTSRSPLQMMSPQRAFSWAVLWDAHAV